MIYFSWKVKQYKDIILLCSLSILITSIIFIYGAIVLSEKIINIAMIAVPTSINQLLSSKLSAINSQIDRYIHAIDTAALQGAKIIVLPEKIIAAQQNQLNQVINKFKQSAITHNTLIVASLRVHGKVNHNVAYVFFPSGTVKSYQKIHLLPGPESSYQAGHALLTFSYLGIKVGIAICKDMDFVYPALHYAQQNINLMLVPALDFHIDAHLHQKPAILRAIEGGYTLTRVAQ